ncbi:MAG: DNA polymerase III subunit epsilon [Candidatus Westeberhardia cardiocondylae]|nr:DNA polymerase III subunit epsilon [Candidatus Westeberhardia cardiocondylae]
MRQVALDIETTGMNKSGIHYKGHRIIEIGAIEILRRRITGRYFHTYLNPNRIIDVEAFNVHGINDNFLHDKPCFRDKLSEFLDFIYDSELVVHNSNFDIGFINYEISMLNCYIKNIEESYKVIDTLKMARKIFPGKKNNLNALCERYFISNDHRTLHGALLDAELLANVFLRMTSCQISFDFFTGIKEKFSDSFIKGSKFTSNNKDYKFFVIDVNSEELLEHQKKLFDIKNKCGFCLWLDE